MPPIGICVYHIRILILIITEFRFNIKSWPTFVDCDSNGRLIFIDFMLLFLVSLMYLVHITFFLLFLPESTKIIYLLGCRVFYLLGCKGGVLEKWIVKSPATIFPWVKKSSLVP